MPLENWALASLSDLKAYMGGLAGSGQDEALNQSLNEATALIEGRVGRELVTRGAFDEYHSIGPRDALFELYVSEWPIIAVTAVFEDSGWPRTYGVDFELAPTDYEVSKSEGFIRRLGHGAPMPWQTGSRVVRLTYSAGYRNQLGQPVAALPVPYDLKKAALFVAASIFKESERQRWGVSAVTDAVGTVTRYVGHFTVEIEKDLRRYERREFHRTWEKVA